MKFVSNQIKHKILKWLSAHKLFSPERIAKDLKIQFSEIGQILDLMIINGYLRQISTTNDEKNASDCPKGCVGCPLGGSCQDKFDNRSWILTDKAKEFLHAR